MPGGDGTGPNGRGPLTGRGAGFCAGYQMPGYTNRFAGCGFGFGRGGGRGFGGGWGRGFWGGGFRRGGMPGPAAYPLAMTPEQESAMLKAQVKAMQDEIAAVSERIKELESAAQAGR